MVRKIYKHEIPVAASTLVRAFSDYEEAKALVAGMKNGMELIEKYFECQMKAVYNTGDIYVFDDLKAVCYGYDSKKHSIILDIFKIYFRIIPFFMKLPKEDRSRFRRNTANMSGMDSPFWYREHIKGRFYYILTIGVDPTMQGQGRLKQLIAPIIEGCGKENIPVLIDTHSETNVSIYSHYGFKTVKSYVSEDGSLTKYCMIRN